MKINGITVCVDYAPYLALTLDNRHLFDRWTVVTVPRDTDTIDLCKAHNIEYVFSDRLYEGGPFCKGKAINDAIAQVSPQDWICLVDADTFLFAQSLRDYLNRSDLDPDCLYSVCGRFLVEDKNELDKLLTSDRIILKEDLEHYGLFVGYFQMWHSSMRAFYFEESHNAGLDDVLMRDSYHQSKWRMIPAYAVHIGPLWENHNGKQKIIRETDT